MQRHHSVEAVIILQELTSFIELLKQNRSGRLNKLVLFPSLLLGG